MKGKLIVTGDNETFEKKFKDGEKVLIGRSSKRCNVVLHDSKVSSIHCQIDVSDKGWHLKDLGSTNGTYVNGEKVTTLSLKNQDEIQVGKAKIKVEIEDISASTMKKMRSLQTAEITEAWTENDLPTSDSQEEYIHNYRILKDNSNSKRKSYQAEHREHKNVVMIRSIPATSQDENAFSLLVEESKIYDQLDHPRIAQVQEFFLENDTPYIVTEYIQGNLLPEWLAKKEKVSAVRMLRVLAYIASAVKYLHGQEIYDLQLAPENIFIEEVTKKIKLIDIALPQMLKRSHYSLNSTRKPFWQASEKLTPQQRDVQNLGALLFFLLAQQSPQKVAATSKEALAWLRKNHKVPKSFGFLLEKTLLTVPPKYSIQEFYDTVADILQRIKTSA